MKKGGKKNNANDIFAAIDKGNIDLFDKLS